MTIEKRPFGQTKDGAKVDCYTLKDGGCSMEVLTYGGAIRSLVIPVAGGSRDITHGFDDVAGYEAHACYFGAIIGRVSNRIGGARFSQGGKEYSLDKNDGPNCLHGGYKGFDKKVWAAREEPGALALSLGEADAERGFPGNLDVEVRYSLIGGALSIEYIAKSDADTPVNLTNHAYFNLGGHDSGGIENHRIQIISDCITPIDETLIPTGELMDVIGTQFDLREPALIGPGLESTCLQIALAGGYDHNFVLSREPHRDLALAVVLEYGGLKMSCLTTKPGVQFYSGNFLSGEVGKGGAVYQKRSGICLEAQYWPDSVNKPGFPAPILRKGDTYRHKTVYEFEIM
jgi:aldose 1-epimerase